MNSQLHAVAALVSEEKTSICSQIEGCMSCGRFGRSVGKKECMWRKLNHGSSIVQLIAYSLYLSYPCSSRITIKKKTISSLLNFAGSSTRSLYLFKGSWNLWGYVTVFTKSATVPSRTLRQASVVSFHRGTSRNCLLTPIRRRACSISNAHQDIPEQTA
jgi:hypothetical protein